MFCPRRSGLHLWFQTPRLINSAAHRRTSNEKGIHLDNDSIYSMCETNMYFGARAYAVAFPCLVNAVGVVRGALVVCDKMRV
jgi:hypothetical protein